MRWWSIVLVTAWLAGACGSGDGTHPPEPGDDVVSTAEDTATEIDVLANDDDPDGDALVVESVSAPAHGEATLGTGGVIGYTPAPDFHGTDSFSYTVSDGSERATATVAVTVTPVNDAPVVSGESAETAEDTPLDLDVLANDSDVDDDALTVGSLGEPAHGTVELNGDGTVRYTPSENYFGGDSFTYSVDDGTVESAAVEVAISVTAVNDAPTAVADALTTAEDTFVPFDPQALLDNDSDAEGDAITLVELGAPAHGTIFTDLDGATRYIPAANFAGEDSFSYTVTDGMDDSLGQVIVTVTPRNDTPVAEDDAVDVDEDAVADIAVLANDTDVDGDVLEVWGVEAPTYGTATAQPDGTVRYRPPANFSGEDTFVYRATDGSLISLAATVTVTVVERNDAPVARRDFYTTDTDVAIVVAVADGVLANDTDVDVETLAAAVVSEPAHGTLALAADGSFTYTPDAGYAGGDSFVYEASDPRGGTDQARVDLSIGVFSCPGCLDWLRVVASASEDTAMGTAALSDDSIVVTGSYYDGARFADGQPDVVAETAVDVSDQYVARFAADGSLAWVATAGGTGVDAGWAAAALGDDTVVVTGYFTDSVTFGLGEIGETDLIAVDGTDAYLARYDVDGSLLWATRLGGTGAQLGKSVAVLSDDSIVVAGDFGGSLTLAAGTPQETTLDSAGANDLFVARYASNGTLMWARSAGGAEGDSVGGIAARSDDSLVVVGTVRGDAVFGAGEAAEVTLTSAGGGDVAIACFDAGGDLAWARRAGGAGNDSGRALTVLADDTLIVGGAFRDAAVFGEGDPSEIELTGTATSGDGFLARYTAAGQLAWAEPIPATMLASVVVAVALSDNTVIVAGAFRGTARFGVGLPGEVSLDAAGGGDLFVARYSDDGDTLWGMRAGGASDETAWGAAALSDDSVVISGTFYATAIFDPGGANETVVVSAGGGDGFVAHYWP